MLQNQYYNSKLTKNHIEKILSNYNIKYNTMKNEIDAKFNNMIKLFINDIKAFLENIEEISNERKKIKEAENHEIELVLLKSKLEEKNKIENQLRTELELLIKENENLKKRVKFKDQIIRNKNLNLDSNNFNIRLKTELNSNKNKYKKFTTGNNNLKNKTAKKPKEKSNNNVSLDAKTEEKLTIKNNYSHRSNQLASDIVKNIINPENLRYSNTYRKSKKRVNNSMDTRTLIKNQKSKTKKNMNDIEKSPDIKSNQETKSSSKIQNLKNKELLIDEKFNSVEMPLIEPNDENESLTTDEIIEDEIKELELEEENIILLMDKIKQLNQNI